MRMPRRARGISKSKMADDEEAVKDSAVSPEIIPVDVTRGAIFLAGVTLASVVGGFGLSLGIARRRSPDAFSKSQNEAAKLAMKALGWGTLLAVSGVGLLVLGVKTAMGVKDAKEFGAKMTSVLPAKDGKFVSYFDSWKISRNCGTRDKLSDSWFTDSSGNGERKE